MHKVRTSSLPLSCSASVGPDLIAAAHRPRRADTKQPKLRTGTATPAPSMHEALPVREYRQGKLITEWTGPQATQHAVAESDVGLGSAVRTQLRSAFLPEGFPESVSEDYTAYMAWHTIQALTSHVRGILSSQAIFQGVGVGSQAASALGAVFSFFVRDVVGMLGGILFAYVTGASFDANAKQWRLFADVVNNCGMAIELMSPLVPGAFLLMASLGSIARSITGLASGATNAALTQHFGRGSNAADISAKDASRDRAMTIIGMGLGMASASYAAEHVVWGWALFAALTWLHVYANVKAMRCLVLTSLNEPRLELLLRAYTEKDKILTPRQMSLLETLLVPPARFALQLLHGHRPARIVFGARLATVLADTTLAHWRALHPSSTCTYVVQLAATGDVLVVLHTGAALAERLKAFIHAQHLAMSVRGSPTAAASRLAVEEESAVWVAKHYTDFIKRLAAAGWHAEHSFLPMPAWTAMW